MIVLIAGFVAYLALTVLACGYAYWRGGREERLFASLWIASTLASNILGQTDDFRSFAWTTASIDLVTFAVFYGLAIRSDRYWPLWAAGFQLSAVISHIPALIRPTLLREVYGATEGLWGFPILIVLIVGTWRTPRTLLESSPVNA